MDSHTTEELPGHTQLLLWYITLSTWRIYWYELIGMKSPRSVSLKIYTTLLCTIPLMQDD